MELVLRLMCLFSTNQRRRFYPKNYPLWSGLTNMNLNSNPRTIEWINNCAPCSNPPDPEDIGDMKGIIFGADVWNSVKRHWVIELQRLIRARRSQSHGH